MLLPLIRLGDIGVHYFLGAYRIGKNCMSAARDSAAIFRRRISRLRSLFLPLRIAAETVELVVTKQANPGINPF